MAIQRLAYAELLVDDLGASTAFERDVFGLHELTREDGAVGILHRAGLDPWVIDFGEPDKV